MLIEISYWSFDGVFLSLFRIISEYHNHITCKKAVTVHSICLASFWWIFRFCMFHIFYYVTSLGHLSEVLFALAFSFSTFPLNPAPRPLLGSMRSFIRLSYVDYIIYIVNIEVIKCYAIKRKRFCNFSMVTYFLKIYLLSFEKQISTERGDWGVLPSAGSFPKCAWELWLASPNLGAQELLLGHTWGSKGPRP